MVPDAGLRPRILATLPDVAWPVDGGKRLRMAGVLRGLVDVGDVDVAVLFSTAVNVPGTRPVPPDVHVRRWSRFTPPVAPRTTSLRRAVVTRTPTHIAAQKWDLVRRHLRDVADPVYDVVWFGGLDHAQGLAGVVAAGVTFVDCDDVETEKWRGYLSAPPRGLRDRIERIQRRVELPWWGRVQDRAVRMADGIAVCSEEDVHRLGARNAFVVPNTYPDPGPVERITPEGPPRLVMIANWTTPQNRDAAHHLVEDIGPALRHILPDGAAVRLAGRGADHVMHLNGAVDGLVHVVGAVDDVTRELASAHVVVVPMRYGGGTRLKVLEAFAHRVPVVSTSVGCEGLGAADGDHLLIRDDPSAFAAACVDVLMHPASASSRAEAARGLYDCGFRPETAARAVSSAVIAALDGSQRSDLSAEGLRGDSDAR